jgi:hypothetical protein
MKSWYQLWVLLGMFGVMFIVSFLLDRHFKIPEDMDVYTLSDSHGNKVKIFVKKLASTEEREKILSEKLHELFLQQTS